MPTQPLSPADSRNYLGFGRQTVKGTGVAPAFFAAYIGPVSFAHNPNLRDVREAGGGSVIARQNKDFIAPGVQLGTPVRPDIAGALLAFMLGGTGGAPTDLGAGSGPYSHTITPSDGRELVSFERNLADDVIERIVDGVIGQLTIDYRKRDSGPELMMTAVAEGITDEDQGSPVAETYETDRPFLRSDCTWTIDTSLTPANVESATIDLQWTLDTTILADGVTRSDIVKLHLNGSVEVVQLFESADEANAYRLTHYYDGDSVPGTTPGELVYPGDFDVEADYTDPAGANEQRQVKLTLPNINWGEAVLTENDPDASEAVRLTRRGVVVAPAPAVTATVINSRATDYLA